MGERRGNGADARRAPVEFRKVDGARHDQPGREAEHAGAGQRVRRREGENRNRGDERDAEGGRERAQRLPQIAPLPAETGPKRHEQEQQAEDRGEGDREIGRPDGELGPGQRVQHQRIERADEDGGRRGGEGRRC